VRSEANSVLRYAGLAARVRIRELWVNGKPMRWRAIDGMPTPTISKAADTTELQIDQTNLAAPKPPIGAPFRFANVGELEVSQFRDWSEVAALLAPLYAKAATLTPNSPLVLELEKIRRASTDPKTRAEAALRLVQDQVHYVFLGMNSGGFVPSDADVTWARRFGDCKGKTALLLALLHDLGIEAQPVLVNTEMGDQLAVRLPQLGVFDHVLVRARVGGKIFWLDGTRLGDRGLDDIPIPNFRWTLPVQAADAQLEKIEPPPLRKPNFESLKRLDASAGYDSPAPAHLEHIFRGDVAFGWNVSLTGLGRADADRALREYWRKDVPWIDVKTVDFTYDDISHVMRLTMDGAANMDWMKNGDVRDFDIGDSNLGFSTSFKREPGPFSDAPFAVSYPVFNRWTVSITLPQKGAGFRLAGASDVDKTIAARRYLRRSTLAEGVATMTAEEQTLAQEFPAAEADAAAAALRALGSYNVIVRGPATINGTEPSPEPEPTPVVASGFNARGVTYLERHEFEQAIADLSRAVALEPGNAKYTYHRGAAYFETRQDDLALKDFDRAVALNPKDVLPLLARGELLLIKGDEPRARKDFDAAAALSPGDVGVLRRRPFAYERAERYEEAARGYDAVIANASGDEPRAEYLNDRCWARAEWGHELDQALVDCNAALKLKPDYARYLDSRGFVYLRLGKYDEALGDYNAALSTAPTQAASLFGRALAEWAMGRKSEAAVDLALARKTVPTIDKGFARYGVTAPEDLKP
jgi:tetratricopeptide (TPR) repeat protein